MPLGVTAYHWLSVVACAGHLALGVTALLRAGGFNAALLFGLLSFDMFLWNGADVLVDISNPHIWDPVDHLSSSMTMPLALHFILSYTGRARRVRGLVAICYVFFGGLALYVVVSAIVPAHPYFGGSSTWAILMLCGILPCVALCFFFLARSLARERDPTERARVGLMMAALASGTFLGLADVVSILEADTPSATNIGSLLSAILLAIALFRFKLFDNVSRIQALTALVVAVITLGSYVVAFGLFQSNLALFAVAAATVTAISFLTLRTISNAGVKHRARVEYLVTLGRMSAQLAHDIRNPVAAAKGAVQYLKEELAQGRSIDDQQTYLDLLESQLDRMEHVVSDYGRLGRVEPLKAPLDLNELARSLSAQQGAETNLDPELPRISADAALLTIALENLLRNARESGENGEVQIRVSTEVRRRKGHIGVLLSVADNGAGMNPRVREKAFDDFYTTKSTGSGIGLSFVRRVVEAHMGSVAIESAKTHGTTVSAWIPVQSEDS